MLKSLLRSANFYLVTTVNIIICVEFLRRRIKKLAETDTVTNEKHYVLVKLARGDYNDLNGPETMYYDYKFFKAIKTFKEASHIRKD
jgi:hypothetical protein